MAGQSLLAVSPRLCRCSEVSEGSKGLKGLGIQDASSHTEPWGVGGWGTVGFKLSWARDQLVLKVPSDL